MNDHSTHTSSTSPPTLDPQPRWRRVLVILIVAGVVGGLAALLSLAADGNVPAAVLTGGGAFAGAAGLLLAIAHYADVD